MDALKRKFEQLAARERLLVMLGAALFGVALIILLIVRPISASATNGRELVEKRTELLADVTRVAERLGPQRSGGQNAPVGGDQSLVVIVDRSTRANGLAANLKRNQPDGNDSIRLRLENASFDTVIEWLSDLSAQHGLWVTTVNIDSSGQPGRINCNLTLSRGI